MIERIMLRILYRRAHRRAMQCYHEYRRLSVMRVERWDKLTNTDRFRMNAIIELYEKLHYNEIMLREHWMTLIVSKSKSNNN